MKVHRTALPGVLLVEPDIFRDHRGLFSETFHADRYREALALEEDFVQDNFSRSNHGVIRGMHFQVTRPQGKLVRVSRGRIYDVVVDIDPSSPTYGRWVGVELDDESLKQLWVPPGYAHGFCVISDTADVHYKCTEFYRPEDEGGLRWSCDVVSVKWPVREPILSPKDASYPGLLDLPDPIRAESRTTGHE